MRKRVSQASMKDRIPKSTSFEFLDYHSHDDPKPGPEISVKSDAFWSYCGPLLSGPEDMPSNLDDWSAASLSSPLLPLLLPFLAFANAFIAQQGLDHYWVTIRATKATGEFDQPRWHTDDLFFSADGSGGLRAPAGEKKKKTPLPTKRRKLDLQTDWKLCTTLLGPSTMFIPSAHQARARETQRTTKRALATDHACTSIRCLGCAATAEAVRSRLADELAPLGRAQAASGACAFFRIGEDGGAVHSEPGMGRGDRIFVNVVPGRRDELGRLMTTWGMGFPRAWWIAPAVPSGREAGLWKY
ncbi:Uu.00g070560.m01.CDS01 [Anthostomella pinea]|uniref:Uu.00g070560.m01.CDS01 n=1 Tax=Anthostomella pinea TaxID=933095 RepID=A0AAI8VUR4_9PEZI|nr:Uu.00g070560.m01.CDS01 [Anthostomella pinea]